MVGYERKSLPLILKWPEVWVPISVVIVCLAWSEAIAALGNRGAATTNFHINPGTGRIHDGFGRERIFHGLNVVVKGAPWHPRVDAFDPQSSFTDEDIALLQEWGMTVVRLGIMWPGVEPSRGSVNSTYLEVMRSIVSKLHSAGIYTLLEFHQDLYASPFCGEGLPSWILDDDDLSRPLVHVHQTQNSSASLGLQLDLIHQNATNSDELENHREAHTRKASLDTSAASSLPQVTSPQTPSMPLSSQKMRYLASFPEPLGRRWPSPSEWEKDGWEPPLERCSSHEWWMFYLSYAVSRAFQDLYDNKWAWGDLLARYWTVVSGAFKDQPGVLGYELMNEPWPGDVFSNPLLFLPGVADKKNLAPFYEKLQAAVRAVDRERILFVETITFDNFRCGWSAVPGGVEWKNKTVLSYHYYTPPNFSPKQAFAERSKESKRLGCGSMLTEFFVSTEQNPRGRHDFRKARLDILRTASRTEMLNPSRRADKEAVALGEGPLRGTYSKKRRRHFQEESGLRSVGVKREEVTQAEEGGEGDVEKDVRSSQDMQKKKKKKKTTKKAKEEVDLVKEVLSAADTYVQSWIAWEYKAFFHKTGSIAGQSLFRKDGEVEAVLAKELSRTYPQSVCGSIIAFTFDPPSSLFSLSFVAGRDCVVGDRFAPTEIFVHRKFYYPNGLLVEVTAPCASFTETDRKVQITHNSKCSGYVIDVRISRVDP